MTCFQLGLLGLLMAQFKFITVIGADPELVLLNVVHRHGDRTPSSSETYPNDPYINYTYWPIGRGELTNDGKLRQYQLGETLRSLYDDFLGPIYYPEILEARSTQLDRTKMSAQLFLSGLFPPTPMQNWNEKLLWQPIPTVYYPLLEDIQLLPFYCSAAYVNEFEDVLATTEVQHKISQFDGLMSDLKKLTGRTISDSIDLFSLYATFASQSAANLTLPDWVHEFYPNGELLNACTLHYELMTYNDDMKRKFGGTLLRKITDDVMSYSNGTLGKGRKLFHYSGHDLNIVALQAALGVYEPHVPAFTSAMILEVWKQRDELYVKVLYFKGMPAEIVTQQIPGCDVLCPFSKFLELLQSVIATDSDYSCDCQPQQKFCRDYWRL